MTAPPLVCIAGLVLLAIMVIVIAVLCIVVGALYLNELWLAPFSARTTLDLLRGLTILAFPVAAAAGVALARRPAVAAGAVAGSAALAVLAALLVVPAVCVSKPIEIAEIESFDVDRCTFRWRKRRAHSLPLGVQRGEIGPDRGVEGAAPLERAPQ